MFYRFCLCFNIFFGGRGEGRGGWMNLAGKVVPLCLVLWWLIFVENSVLRYNTDIVSAIYLSDTLNGKFPSSLHIFFSLGCACACAYTGLIFLYVFRSLNVVICYLKLIMFICRFWLQNWIGPSLPGSSFFMHWLVLFLWVVYVLID